MGPQLISHSDHVPYGADKAASMKDLLLQMQDQVDPMHKELHDFVMNGEDAKKKDPKLLITLDHEKKDDASDLKKQLEEYKKKFEGNAKENEELKAKLLALKGVEQAKDDEMRKKEDEEKKKLENEK